MSVLLAMLLDAALGEPRWLWDRLPHPAVVMGKAVDWLDRTFNAGSRRRLKGALGLAGLVLSAATLGIALRALPGIWAEVILGAMLLAQKSLVQHVQAVAAGLRLSLGDGQRAVSMIVSRDTDGMDASAIARSALESAAENLSDGVIAPVFWFLVGGLPGLLVYKITNTADSMIGYRTPRHEAFGWAAARFDDLLNLAPARLTALLIWLAGGAKGQWSAIIADARRHRSPNAGWPEAAMSRALGVALAGPRSYDGAMRDFPYVNDAGRRDIGAEDIDAGTRLLWGSWGIALALCLGLTLIFG